MNTIEIGWVGAHSVYYQIRDWKEYEVSEWKPQHEELKKEIEENMKVYSTQLKNLNAELELCKKQAKLRKRHVKLRKMDAECTMEYYKTRLECGPDCKILDLGWTTYIEDELYEIEGELCKIEGELSKIEEELQGRQ